MYYVPNFNNYWLGRGQYRVEGSVYKKTKFHSIRTVLPRVLAKSFIEEKDYVGVTPYD